jgi:hypothetical protein
MRLPHLTEHQQEAAAFFGACFLLGSAVGVLWAMYR